LLALLACGAATASAHVTEKSGGFEVEMGWGEEPPRVGAQNFVEVNVSDGHGDPVAVPAGALSVEVVYGSSAVTLPLSPTPAPGSLEAPLTPTRPGAYAFNVSGSIDGQPLDASASCSESTFECVETDAANEFPVRDPSAGELAQRLGSEADRVEEAGDKADQAGMFALAVLAVAALALAISIWTARRRGSDPT
jgi:hypothetical protein